MRYFWQLGVAMCLFAALAIGAGCGGDGSPEPTRQPTATAGEANGTPRPDGDEGDRAGEAPAVPRTPVAGADFLDRLEGMLERYRSASFKVTARAFESGEEHEVTIAQLSGLDWEKFEGFQSIIRKQQALIRKGDEYFSCTTPDKECRRSEFGLGAVAIVGAGTFALNDITFNTLRFTADEYETFVANRDVGGERATCFIAVSKGDRSEYELCFADDGVPLFWRTSDGFAEATSVSRNVTEAEFELPFPVTE